MTQLCNQVENCPFCDCNFFAHLGSALVSCLKSVDNHCVSFPWVRTFGFGIDFFFFFFFWWPISK